MVKKKGPKTGQCLREQRLSSATTSVCFRICNQMQETYGDHRRKIACRGCSLGSWSASENIFARELWRMRRPSSDQWWFCPPAQRVTTLEPHVFRVVLLRRAASVWRCAAGRGHHPRVRVAWKVAYCHLIHSHLHRIIHIHGGPRRRAAVEDGLL